MEGYLYIPFSYFKSVSLDTVDGVDVVDHPSPSDPGVRKSISDF